MELGRTDHRSFRPAGWIEAGLEKLDRLRPFAERADLTTIQLACQWNLAHPAVESRRPDPDPGGRRRRPARSRPSAPSWRRCRPSSGSREDDREAIRAIGDNTGCMALKGANPDFEGDEQPDRWALTSELAAVGARWGIDPGRDLAGLR